MKGGNEESRSKVGGGRREMGRWEKRYLVVVEEEKKSKRPRRKGNENVTRFKKGGTKEESGHTDLREKKPDRPKGDIKIQVVT